MGLADRVNSILAGEPVDERKAATEERPRRWKKPLAFGELPKDVAIPMDKSRRIKIVEKKSDGTILLCGKVYSDKGRTEKGWRFHDAVDVMSWAYANGFQFRPKVWGYNSRRSPAAPEDVEKVEVYIRRSSEFDDIISVKQGTGLKFRFETDGRLSYMSYRKDETHQYLGSLTGAEIWKGCISADNRYGDSIDFEFGDTVGFW